MEAQEALESLLSNLLIGRGRRSSRPPRHAIATSCANWGWGPTRSSTTPPRASRRWSTVLMWSLIWLVATPWSAPGRWSNPEEYLFPLSAPRLPPLRKLQCQRHREVGDVVDVREARDVRDTTCALSIL